MSSSHELVGLDLSAAPWRSASAPWRLIEAHGPDAADFLHRLCSQDVLAMSPGDARPAAFLTPKGKLVATAWLGRLDDRIWIETEAHVHDTLAELLERYHFSEKLSIRAHPELACEELVGARAAQVAGVPPTGCVTRGAAVVLSGGARGAAFVRVHAPAGAPPFATVPRVLDAEQREALRIASGIVRVGTDTDATTLASEAHLEDHLSTTKGCYTGQEIVARIQTYGHVNRALCVLRISGDAPVAPGTLLCEREEGEPVGRVTSTARVPGAQRIALGWLPADLARAGTGLTLADRAGPQVVVLDFPAA
jgi:tRNA-modifying protein YgfZ